MERRVMSDFGERVARVQDRALAGMRFDATKARLLARPGRRGLAPPTRARWIAPLLAAALVAAALIVWLRPRRELHAELSNGGPAMVGQWIGAPADAPESLRFNDGTLVVLAPGSSARVASADAEGARVVIERGSVSVAVTPLEGARWSFEVGPFTVRVTGTRFRARWKPDTAEFHLELDEGSVVVSGPMLGTERRVATGEVLAVSVAVATVASASPAAVAAHEAPKPAGGVEDAPAPAASLEPIAAPSASQAVAAAETAKVEPPVTWQALARGGDYTRALARARAEGLEPIVDGATAEELWILADAARLAGDHAAAAAALRALRQRYPGGAQAATAAFLLGRMAFDQDGAYAGAAGWFTTYLTEQPGGAFAREALGRLFEACHLAGNETGARAAARAYLDAYPNGPHADQARSLLGEGVPPAPAASGDRVAP
jgi:transmembrane sensor